MADFFDNSEKRLDFLASATRLLVSSLDFQATLDQVAHLAVPRMADWCLVDIAEENGTYKRVAVAHAKDQDADLARYLLQQHAANFPTERPHAHLYEEVTRELLAQVIGDKEACDAFEKCSVTSGMTIPLVVRDAVLGHITMFTAESGRRYVPEDLALVTEIAKGAALAIDNARLFSEAQRASDRKDETLALLDTFLGKTPVAIAFLDNDLKYLLVNEYMAKFNGKSVEDHLGKPIREILPMAAHFLEPMFQHVLTSGQPMVDLEFGDDNAPLAEGERTYWLGSVYPVALRDRMLGIGVVVRDITPQKRLELELRKRVAELADADHRKDEFLAMLAHELRNPLGAIAFSVQGLEASIHAGDSYDSRSRQFGSTIKKQTHELARLVDDLLDVSRITRGKIQLRKVEVNFVDLLRQSIHTNRASLEAARHRLDVLLPSEPMVMVADPSRLEQIIGNLIDNAVKYTPSGGVIRITLENEHAGDGTFAVLKVSDTGVGIAPELLPRVFDLFTQSEQSLDRSRGGLGIGLTIVQRLVALHGGTVSASSPGVGCGSEFVVRLPSVGISFEAVTAIATRAVNNSRPGSLRIALVEDNADMRTSLRELLELWGHRVFDAMDGVEGIEMILGNLPDISIVDIGLPRMDGYQVAGRIRAHTLGESLYLVAMTGYGREEDRTRALESGFDTHLVKPVDSDVLLAVLAKATERLRLTR